ncbi:hypothetical protein SLE2022_070880 [Rubroshorea leprosula]
MASITINLSILASSSFSLEKLKFIPSSSSSSCGNQKSFMRAHRFPGIKAVVQPQKANPKDVRQRRSENVDGDFFVDHTCIDCDTCRWVASETFARVDGMSAVFKQPNCKEDRLQALQALVSCPTGSIHTEQPPASADLLEAKNSFPIPIDEHKLPGVYHCGFHSLESQGTASYLIIHPEGNILVDTPKYNEGLAHRIEMLGGVRYMVITHNHKDDVADPGKWSKRLNCDRVLHHQDVKASTANVEIKLEGNGPWSLASDVMLIHTPGHTEGAVSLFHKSLKVIFTGDHLIMTKLSGLSILDPFSHSVPKQLKSVEKLLELDFQWIIPAHGRRFEFKDSQEKNSMIGEFLQKKYSQISQT